MKSLKEPLRRILLMETNICVVIAIRYANNQVTNNRHAGAITKELLVCKLCIILLSLHELFSCVSSFIALRIVSELQVRSVG